jgi:hypothetical protein
VARRVGTFIDRNSPGQRRYPWTEWTDGSIWEIRKDEDYEIATENMRINVLDRGKHLVRSVRTQIVRDEHGEGLRFQFGGPLTPTGPVVAPNPDAARGPDGRTLAEHQSGL